MAEAESGAPDPSEDGPAPRRTEDGEAVSSVPDGTAWLATLEQRVHEACERLRELTAENQRLERRVAELEAAAEREETVAGSADGGEAWRRERREIRRRVESLTGTLESLLPR